MIFLTILGIYAAVLFALFFVSKKHIGMAALGLTAGAVLAELWTDSLTPLVAQAGIVIEKPPLHSLVAIALTLIPAFLVMSRSTKAHSKMHQIYSSLIFAVMAVALTYGAFANAIVMDEMSSKLVLQVLPYDNWIITGCIILGLVDVLYHRKTASHAHKK